MISACIISAILIAAPAAGLPVRAVTIEGQALEVTWAGLSASGTVLLLENGTKKEFPLDELMLLRWSEPPASRPASSQPVTAYLADGGRLAGRITGGDAKTITFATELVPEVHLPLTRLAAIRFGSTTGSAAGAAFEKALSPRDPAQDTLLVVREGRVTALKGVTESLGPKGGSFRWRERSVPVNPESAYAIVFAAGVQTRAVPQATCVLKDGSTWAGKLTAADADSITIEFGEGLSVALPVAKIEEIRFRSGRVVFVSDLEPAEFVMEPYGATKWPYRKDRSAANRPLTIADQRFERGIGMHSRSVLSYDLPGPFSQLAAVIGIDAGAAPLGSVIFRVTVDGKEAYNSGPVTGRDAPKPINVPIAGAKRFQLVVDFGDELDIGDQADWGNLRLIK